MEQVLATSLPTSVRETDVVILDLVMREVRAVAAAAQPTDVITARQFLWALAPFAVWLHHKSGSFHKRLVDSRNVDVWINVRNKGRENGWRHLASALLKRVGRTVNPDGWPRPTKPIGRNPVARPYEPKDEALFRHSAALPKHKDRPGLLFVVGAGMGAGLNGRELADAETSDVLDIGNDRLAICTRGNNERLVPVRADYTDMVHDAVLLAAARGTSPTSNRFVQASHKGAVTYLLSVLDFGRGSFSLSRSRMTWIMAHLLVGTPFVALRVIAGPLSAQTIDELVALISEDLNPMDAVSQGLMA